MFDFCSHKEKFLLLCTTLSYASIYIQGAYGGIQANIKWSTWYAGCDLSVRIFERLCIIYIIRFACSYRVILIMFES